MPRAFLLLACALFAHPALAQPDWSTPPGFEHSMSITATVAFDGTFSADATDRLAPFIDGEVRGVASGTVLGGQAYFFLSIVGDTEGKTVTLKAYDASSDQERDLCTELRFTPDASRGTISDPVVLHTADGASQGQCALRWQPLPGYGQSMSLNTAVALEGVRSDDPNDRVAAFIGPEVRGVGAPFTVDGQQVFFLEVDGESASETISFQVYDASAQTTHTVSQTTTYAAGGSQGTPSSPLMLTTDAVLPVELVVFEAHADGGEALLRWRTASETNNAGFTIEQADGTAWREVGFVPGVGTTLTPQDYSYRLPVLAAGTHRFRLRQHDFDGRLEYSPVVEVSVPIHRALELTAAFPNPFTQHAEVTLSVAETQAVRVTVADLQGREVAVLHDGVVLADTPHRLSIHGQPLASGLYLVRAVGRTHYTVQQLVKLTP
ncbi:MAG: T9SS type A sorting domain-containing protein [Bacteroidota bacterium]